MADIEVRNDDNKALCYVYCQHRASSIGQESTNNFFGVELMPIQTFAACHAVTLHVTRNVSCA